jgi:hypothetical protein
MEKRAGTDEKVQKPIKSAVDFIQPVDVLSQAARRALPTHHRAEPSGVETMGYSARLTAAKLHRTDSGPKGEHHDPGRASSAGRARPLMLRPARD